jgi:hypothetical protein
MNAFLARRAPLAVVAAVVLSIAALPAARAQAAPPWGSVAYQAEVATYLDDEPIGRILVEAAPAAVRYTALDPDGAELLVFLLTWDGADVAAWILDEDAGGFLADDTFLETVLAGVVDPLTPGIGSCAVQGASCTVEGEGAVDGRAARRVAVDRGDGARSTIWVDARTGLAIAGEGTAEGASVRTELLRFAEEAPNPARLRP